MQWNDDDDTGTGARMLGTLLGILLLVTLFTALAWLTVGLSR